MNKRLRRALVVIHNSRATSATESQRDSGLKPKVARPVRYWRPTVEAVAVPLSHGARHELPWVNAWDFPNPTGVAAASRPTPTQPRWGWLDLLHQTQGSSCFPTLGWRPQSLWDFPQTLAKFRAMKTVSARFNVPCVTALEMPDSLPIGALKRRECRAPLAPNAGHPTLR